MGRNTAIKRYDPAAGAPPADIFSSKEGRLPIIVALLRSPWIFTGSDFEMSHGAGIGKIREDVVNVTWDKRRGCPLMFEWRSRSYRIDAIVQRWTIERYWWDSRRRISRRAWRVLATGGTYDLAYDRLARVWRLTAVQD